MSSLSDIDSLQFSVQQINIYGGLFLFITGIFGELLNIIVFITVKTFWQTTCAFYLIVASIANIVVVITILLRVIYEGFNIVSSYTPLLCKFRYSMALYLALLCLTSMCLDTINQFVSMTTYRKWTSLRIAHRFIACASVFWFIYSIFFFIYYDSYLNTYIITNVVFAKYIAYFDLPIILGIWAIIILIISSLLAIFKVRTIAGREINIIRSSRDRQLTAMTLFHVLFIVTTTISFVMFYTYTLTINTKDPIVIAKHQLIYVIIVYFYDMNYSVSFFFKKNAKQ